MSRIIGKGLFKASLGVIWIKYLRSVEKFAIRGFKGQKTRNLRISRSELYEFFTCPDNFTHVSEYDTLSLIQYEFIFNWKVCCSVIKEEHKFRLGRVKTAWVKLEKRRKKIGGRKRNSGVKKSEYQEAIDNILVAKKYRDRAWFVEYFKRICLFENREFNLEEALEEFFKA